MKRTALLILMGFAIGSCEDNFINHKIEFTKTGACGDISPQVEMESSIMGNKYKFTQCLPDNFDEKGYSVIRKSDTLVVSFTKTPDRPQNAYKLTLEIDTDPYNFIVIDGQILVVGQVDE